MKIKQQIIVCPNCEGKGTEEIQDSGYSTETIECYYCGGTRVVLEKITHEKLKLKIQD